MTVLTPIAARLAIPATASPTPSAPADVDGFETAVSQVAASAEAPSTEGTASSQFQHQSSHSGRLKPEQAFESFVLRSFIEEMLPKENTAVFGGGTAGNIWRSMLAERIADEMAASGGIGIAKTIARDAKTPAGG